MAKRQHQPRYRGIVKLKTLRERIEQLNSMCKCIVCYDHLALFTIFVNVASYKHCLVMMSYTEIKTWDLTFMLYWPYWPFPRALFSCS